MSTLALGLIEAIGLPVAIEAADAAVKSANVALIGYELAKGDGMVTVKIEGDVGAVKAAVDAAVAAASRIGQIYSTTVIPRPGQGLENIVLTKDTVGLENSKEQPPEASPEIEPVIEIIEENIEPEAAVAAEEETKKEMPEAANEEIQAEPESGAAPESSPEASQSDEQEVFQQSSETEEQVISEPEAPAENKEINEEVIVEAEPAKSEVKAAKSKPDNLVDQIQTMVKKKKRPSK